MEKLYIIKPNKNISPFLHEMIDNSCKHYNAIIIQSANNLTSLKNKKILFVMELSKIGYDIPMLEFLSSISIHPDALENSIGAILVHSYNEFSTKRAAQDLIFIANNLGCTFIGHPLVEATNSLRNFLTWKKTINIPVEQICFKMCSKLSKNLINYSYTNLTSPKILVLYSSPHTRSNTLDLWNMVSKHLGKYNIKKLQIENGKIMDCKGCPYHVCLHYGKQRSCFYGGFIVSDVLPAIEKSDIIIWLCPNYNDSIAANITAVINRLTALYRVISFENKSIFAIIVSGNSGSDSIAKQLIGSLNINKGFRLPPYFSISAIANDPGSIFKIKNIEKRAYNYALNIKNSI